MLGSQERQNHEPVPGPVRAKAIGFLANTPDGTSFATNFHADYFLNHQISVGPLAQLAVTEIYFKIGFSGQGKYWLDLSGLDQRLRMNLQGGLGFLHADLHKSDTSFLIPIGVGLDFALNQAGESHLHLLAQLHGCRHGLRGTGTKRDAGADVRHSLLESRVKDSWN